MSTEMTAAVRPSHRRLTGDRWVDHAEIITEPRWKTSELSGDEWRFTYVVRLWRKGHLLAVHGCGTMAYAAAWMALALQTASPADLPWPPDAPGQPYGDGYYCDNIGCAEPADWRAWLKAEYDSAGHKSTPDVVRPFRVFCSEHSRRGDCSMEDRDANYEIEPILPAGESA